MKTFINIKHTFIFLLLFALSHTTSAQLVFNDDSYVYKKFADSTGLFFSANLHNFLNSDGASVMNINTQNGTVFNFGGVIGLPNQPIFGNISAGLAGISNAAEINYGAYVASFPDSNNFALYTDGNATITGSIIFISDGNLKQAPIPIDNALEKVMELDPVSYYFKPQGPGKINLPTGLQNGFVAQEVKSLFPELVHPVTHPEFDENGQIVSTSAYEGVNYIGFIPVLVEALQTQQTLIEEQNQRIDELEAKLNILLNQPTLPELIENSSEKTGAVLSNQPNPFSNSTEISYTLPEQYKEASIRIFDMSNGTLMESVPLNGSGQGSIPFSCADCRGKMLVASLYIDGKISSTIKMQAF